MKIAMRFEKTEAVSNMPNDEIIALFREAFLGVPELLAADRLSLASTNQKYGFIAGIDYLFADLAESFLQDKAQLTASLNNVLAGKLTITHLVSIEDLAAPGINKYAYYMADLSRFNIPSDFINNLTFIMTRDTNAAGESIAVTDYTYRMKGNLRKNILKTYPIIELVPHIHFAAEDKKLYFVADGNVPAFILLAGLLYGRCSYFGDLVSGIKLTRLDYVDGTQKIKHNIMNYDNVLGEHISIE
jgi:hypothetical protein